MRSLFSFRTGLAGAIAAAATVSANAVIITISPMDTPLCDVLSLPQVVHELGTPPLFPTDELIECTFTFTDLSACPAMDDPDIPNILLIITNLSPFAWVDLHYVADASPSPGGGGTTISNEDGLVTGGQAFAIDTVGVNTPLVFESIAADLIFLPGETWHFIIQDYSNTLGLSPAMLGSIGVGLGSAGDPISSGSIVALEIPAPGVLALLAMGGFILNSRRRR